MLDGEQSDAGAGGAGGGDDVAGREADRRLRLIARRRAGLDAEEAKWLLIARREEVHRLLGFATFGEYVERVLGHGPRACADRLRVAEALEVLPATRAALASGAMGYSTVREVVRVAVPGTEDAWVAAAKDKTVREVEELVAGHRPGDLPDDPTDPDLRLRTLRIELSPATYAMFREVEQRLRKEAGHHVTDDDVISTMCRAVLAPSEPAADPTHVGRANMPHYQIAMTICEECKRGWQDGGGKVIEVGRAAIATASCDAQLLGRVDGSAPTRATRTIPPATRRLVLRRDHRRCVVPGCRSSAWIDVHHIHPRGRGGGHGAHNLVTMCGAHHQLLHHRRIAITGAPGRWIVWNRDGRPWGSPPSEWSTDAG
jgi:hypothetical protein